MTTAIPESLQGEFTQEEWNNLTDAERQGMIEDGEDDGNPSPEELERQQEEDRQREAAAAAAAAAQQTPEKTDAEREAEAAAAATKTGDDKTGEQKQQETAAQQQEQTAPVTPRPRGVVDATLPDDFDALVKSNDEAMSALEKRYEDGDISFAEYRAEQRTLDKEARRLERLADRAELARESSQQALINHWTALINPFTAAHPELSEDDVSKSAFDVYLKQTTGPVMQAGGMPGQAEIDKAYQMWCKRFNFTPTGQQQTAAAKKDVKVPPTLGGLPASSATDVQDGKLAAIQRLSGVEYEEALAKLTPAELEQLSKYA